MFLDGLMLHAQDKKFLLNFAALQNRPHALLLDTGQAGLDENLLLNMAKYFLCINKAQDDFCNACISCKAFNLRAHPDLMDIRVEDKKQLISIQQIKELIGKLGYTPSISTLRVCIIREAQLLNEASANALLKHLEEPEGEQLYILTTNNVQAVLPTILSRTIIWHLIPLDIARLNTILSKELEASARQALIRLAGLNLQKLHKLAEKNGQEIRLLAYDFLYAMARQELLHESLQSRWSLVTTRENFTEFVFYLNHFLRDILLVKNNCANLVHNIDMQAELHVIEPAFSSEQVFKLLTMLETSEAMQFVNISAKLLLDNLFVQSLNK